MLVIKLISSVRTPIWNFIIVKLSNSIFLKIYPCTWHEIENLWSIKNKIQQLY